MSTATAQMQNRGITELQKELERQTAALREHIGARNYMNGVLDGVEEMPRIRVEGKGIDAVVHLREMDSGIAKSIATVLLEYHENKAVTAWHTAYDVCSAAVKLLDDMALGTVDPMEEHSAQQAQTINEMLAEEQALAEADQIQG